MGVDTKMYLPPQVRLEDVAQFMGILSGLPHASDPYLRVQGVQWRASNPVAAYAPMLTLHFDAPDGQTLVDGERGHCAYYHGVSRGSDEDHGAPLGYHKFTLRSTAYWIAVARRTVAFFGGIVDYNDCDDTDVDYKVSARPAAPSDGAPWDAHQARLASEQALTVEDLIWADRFATYKMQETVAV